MKKINYSMFFVFLMINSLCVSAEVHKEKTSGSWYKSFKMTDYLPAFIGKKIIAWRTDRMFSGTQSFVSKLMELVEKSGTSGQLDESKMSEFVQSYNRWIQSYADVINERGYPNSKAKIRTSIAMLWIGLQLISRQEKWDDFVIKGIDLIIENLQQMGAKVGLEALFDSLKIFID
jgi:hypothetical protein